MRAPEDVDIWNATDTEAVRFRSYLEGLVQNIRRDETAGIVLPHDVGLELLSTGGTRQFNTNEIIERYDSRMAMTVLADFVLLGHQQVGSFALSSDKTKLFSVAIGAFLKIICEVFNRQAIPRLIDINEEHFSNLTDYPEMNHGDVEDVNLKTIAEFLKDMTAAGIIIPDEQIEEWVRRTANLPDKVEEGNARPVPEPRKDQINKPQPPDPEDLEEIDEPNSDELLDPDDEKRRIR